MRHHILVLVLSVLGLVLAGTGCGGGGEASDSFVGAYQTNLTISGNGSQTFTDNLTINEGTASDLVISSQQLGNLKASIVGKNSFSIDQQQITLTDSTGQAFSVTVMGQGTVTDNVFSSSGTLSSNTGALSFTMNGQKL
jgi:hypothetical protein